jgi:hypothetical protein
MIQYETRMTAATTLPNPRIDARRGRHGADRSPRTFKRNIRALILEEAACFEGFSDLLVPERLHALEIKSAVDDLRRLRYG